MFRRRVAIDTDLSPSASLHRVGPALYVTSRYFNLVFWPAPRRGRIVDVAVPLAVGGRDAIARPGSKAPARRRRQPVLEKRPARTKYQPRPTIKR